MKLTRAIFDFDGAQIVFNHAAADVIVTIGEISVTYDNEKRQYKPCVTHCEDLLRMVRGEWPRAANLDRLKATRSKLKLARVESERPKRKGKT